MNKDNKNTKELVNTSFFELAKAMSKVCKEEELIDLLSEASESKAHRELWKLTIDTLALLDRHTNREELETGSGEIIVKFEGNPSIKRTKTEIFNEL